MSVPAAYIGVILIWSTTPLAIKWSSDGGNFLFAAFGRMLIGMIVCYALVALLRTPMPWRADARRTYIAAGLGIYGALGATYWGAQYISSGMVSVLFGLTPLFTSMLAYFWLNERSLTLGKLGGIALGFCGLVLIFGSGWNMGEHSAWGVTAVLAAVIIQCASLVWVKRLNTDIHALHVTTGALYVAVPLFALTWWLGGGTFDVHVPQRAAWSIVYLGVFGSVMGFVLYFYVIKHLPTGTISLITLVTPVMALLLGAVLNGEHITHALLWGTGGILCGLMVHQWGDAALQRARGIVA